MHDCIANMSDLSFQSPVLTGHVQGVPSMCHNCVHSRRMQWSGAWRAAWRWSPARSRCAAPSPSTCASCCRRVCLGTLLGPGQASRMHAAASVQACCTGDCQIVSVGTSDMPISCQQVPGLEPTALDNAVNTVTADNLDLGCRMIEKAAHDKAVIDIDQRLTAGYTASHTALFCICSLAARQNMQGMAARKASSSAYHWQAIQYFFVDLP